MKAQKLQATLHRLTQPSIQEEISKAKGIIQNIKSKHAEKLLEASVQQQQDRVSPNHKQLEQTLAQTRERSAAKNRSKSTNAAKPSFKSKRNEGVSDTDRMVFDKKFKNYLNHKEQFARKARERRERILELRRARKEGALVLDENEFIDKEELMSEEGNENQFQDAEDMQIAYREIATGKRTRKDGALYHAEKFEYLFRRDEFDYLLMEEAEDLRREQPSLAEAVSTIGKGRVLDYLFDEPCIMMLYSINPYQLGDELAEFQTQTPERITFEEFSHYLLIDREPTYFAYTRNNLEEARKIGRGIKCMPIIGKWIGDDETLEWLLQIFKDVDMLGDSQVERAFLARKIRMEAKKKRILHTDLVEIVNINKLLPLSRLLYELEFGVMESDKIRATQFEQFLTDYKRIQTPEKDKLWTKLIVSGKYDPSYIFILGAEPIDFIKSTFRSMQKFAEYFVLRDKFIEKLQKSPKFAKLRNCEVRSEGNRYVKKQTISSALERFAVEAETYVDLEEILDFFTNRGRPQKTEHQIYLINLELQLQRIEEEERRRAEKKLSEGDLSTSSDEEEFQNQIRLKKIQRKKDRLASIRSSENYGAGKRFIITVPDPFSFGTGVKDQKKTSIRQRKMREMLEEKLRLEDESLEPIRPKQVPAHVKDNLYERIMRDQERARKERLDKFRLESQSRMYPVSEHLVKKKSVSVDQQGVKSKQYKFVAKPLPWYCEVNLMERIESEKAERRERILEEVINKHSEYDLPDGVKLMMEREQQTKERRMKAQSISTATGVEACTFMPHITSGVPDFRTIHEHLQVDLENRKQAHEPIKVEPFSFENREKRSKTAVEGISKSKVNQNKHSRLTHRSKGEEQVVNVPVTLKYEALVELRRRQEQERVKKAQKQLRDSTVRKLRQQKFAPYVREVLKKNESELSKSRLGIAERIKEFKKEERRKKAEHEEEMIAIYTKVFNRPLLIESSGAYGENQLRRKGLEINQEEEYRNVEGEQYTDEENGLQKYAEDYQMKEYESNNPHSKRNPIEYEELRMKAIEHPPRHYMMDDEAQNVEDAEGEAEEYGDGDYEDGEYLSENGRYTQ